MRFLVVGLIVIMCSGCGTIINGRWQTVKISTTPSQAMVKMPDMIENVPTPTSVKIERGQSYLVEITKPGFEDKWIVLQKRKYRSIILADIFLSAPSFFLSGGISRQWDRLPVLLGLGYEFKTGKNVEAIYIGDKSPFFSIRINFIRF